MLVGRAEIVSILKCLLRFYLPQCPFTFEGICYIISSDYSELFFVCLIVAYAALTLFSSCSVDIPHLSHGLKNKWEEDRIFCLYGSLFHSSIVVLYYNISVYLFIFNADKSTIKTELHQLPISRQKLRLYLVCLFFRASTSTHYNNDYIAIITECKSFLFKKKRKKKVCLYAGLTHASAYIDDKKIKK